MTLTVNVIGAVISSIDNPGSNISGFFFAAKSAFTGSSQSNAALIPIITITTINSLTIAHLTALMFMGVALRAGLS